MLKKWHFYKAITLAEEENEIYKKQKAIEKAIDKLEDVDKTIIRMKYFDRFEMHLIQDYVFLSRQGVYYRLEKTYKEIAYLINNTG